jgi:hypothetical protein
MKIKGKFSSTIKKFSKILLKTIKMQQKNVELQVCTKILLKNG